MKKLTWKVPLFVAFILIFAVGFLYLVLREKNDMEKEDLRMSIALVNEDEGANFNGEIIKFGNDFSNNVTKNKEHDWYIVSRGVAENGFNRNVYDMIIIIPNNFSEKSLSFNEYTPEKVTLYYKINTSGHEDVRAQAEKVANNVLNDFNKRLVDVYFASIIGNLQEAQENIRNIVIKEEKYTNLFNETVNKPLSGYTNQFQSIKEYADISKDNYSELDKNLKSFQLKVNEENQEKQNLSMDLNKILERKQKFNVDYINFSEKFNNQMNAFSNANHISNLNNLEQLNKYITNQFSEVEENNENSISNQAETIKQYVDDLKKDLEEFDNELKKRVDEDIDRLVENAVGNSFKNEEKIYIGEFLNLSLEEKIISNINDLIKNIPTIEVEHISNSQLSNGTKQVLLNVALITQKYLKEKNIDYVSDNNNLLSRINSTIKDLKENGLFFKDEVNLKPYDGERYFYINIPSDFQVESLSIKIDETEIPTDNFSQDGFVKLPVSNDIEEQKLEVNIHVKLSNIDYDIDIFSPLEWSWFIKDDGNSTDKNYYLNQNLFNKIIDGSQNELVTNLYEMISVYQQLSSIYSVYYGINMQNNSLKDTIDENTKLSDIAEEQSLYYLFNKQDIAETIKKFILNNVKNNVTEQINQSLAMQQLYEQIDSYRELLEETDNNAKDLLTIKQNVTNEAKNLNQSITKLLNELNDWRNSSNELIKKQDIVINENDELQTVIMNFDKSYQSLLSSSELVAEQAKLNSNNADNVFDTFETLYKQADAVQSSGDTIVKQASDLAGNLIKKTKDDLNFTNNFNEVLANSRVGDRPNEELYDFLSNPVITKNDGIIQEEESFVPYFLVIICSIISLFTGYVITTIRQQKIQNEMFEQLPLYKKNLFITLIAAGIGLIEGLLVSLVSSYLLAIKDYIIWILSITLIMIAMVLITTYLLRQLKMIGMFILLAVFSLHLFITKSLGFNFEYNKLVQKLRDLSPLQYIENLIEKFLEGMKGINSIGFSISIILILIVVSLIANLLVINKKAESEVVEDSDVETNF